WIEPLRPEAQVSVGPTQHVEQIAVLRPESAADRGRGFASGNPVALLASLSVAERSDPDWICVALPAYGKPTSACLETGPRCRCPNLEDGKSAECSGGSWDRAETSLRVYLYNRRFSFRPGSNHTCCSHFLSCASSIPPRLRRRESSRSCTLRRPG